MYVMHHALRRDLAAFAAAVDATPPSDRDAWAALRERWDRFADVSHKHHAAEDAGLWPLLRERSTAAGDADAPATLDAMQAEHARIDPMLGSCRAGFAALADGSSQADRAALAARVRLAAELLDGHLGHEERDAMALVQRHLDDADWRRVEREHVQAGYGPKDLPFVLPWSLTGLPPAARRRAVALGGAPVRLLAALTVRGFRRRERRAFRYVDRVPGRDRATTVRSG